MKKKIILVMLAVALLIGGVAGGVAYAAAGGHNMSGQRLYGICSDGYTAMPPEGDPPFYYLHPGFVITNPDWRYGKTIQRIVIAYGSNGTVYEEITLSAEDAWLAPHEVFNTDFRMLGIPGRMEPARDYTVDVYWEGRGEALMGLISNIFLLAEEEAPGEWVVKDFGPFMQEEMINIR